MTDAATLGLPDFAVRAAALAAAGPALALHARDRRAPGGRLAAATTRMLALARPAEAAVFVNGRPDVAAALGAQGVQLAGDDLTPREVRGAFPAWQGWLGRSVHSAREAEAAAEAGSDYLLAGHIYPTTTHSGLPPRGLQLVRDAATTGLPVIAIGGITPERVAEVREAGGYGVAAITALWRAEDPAAAALALLAPWLEVA